MNRVLSFLFMLIAVVAVKAQIPYFAKTVGNNKLYAYTSFKFRPGENNQETYTTFQYGLGKEFATGMDLYTSNGSSHLGMIARYGKTISKWFNVGVQATPSFNLSDNFKFSYLTTALYLNGSISNDGKLFWCSNTWWGVNKHSSATYSQWTYLGYAFKTGKRSSVTPMIGEIHSWKFDQDMTMAVGAYYGVKNFNLYVWSDKLFDNHPRFVLGVDATL